MSTELLVYGGLFVIGVLILFIGLLEELVKEIRGTERCEICGYLKRGPLHDEDRCEAERDARTMTEDELKKRQLFRTGEDKLGF